MTLRPTKDLCICMAKRAKRILKNWKILKLLVLPFMKLFPCELQPAGLSLKDYMGRIYFYPATMIFFPGGSVTQKVVGLMSGPLTVSASPKIDT